MIRKIRRYKIHLRAATVSRLVKKKLELKEVPAALQEIIDQELKTAQPWIEPASVYETYSQKASPEFLNTLWDQAPKKTLSISLWAVTVGKSLEERLQEPGVAQDPFKRAVLESIAEEALGQSSQFVSRLISEEAQQETLKTEVSGSLEAALWPEALSTLEAAKAGVVCNELGEVTPRLTRVDYCFWQTASAKR